MVEIEYMDDRAKKNESVGRSYLNMAWVHPSKLKKVSGV
jgi:hypothetical protein